VLDLDDLATDMRLARAVSNGNLAQTAQFGFDPTQTLKKRARIAASPREISGGNLPAALEATHKRALKIGSAGLRSVRDMARNRAQRGVPQTTNRLSSAT